MKFISTAGCFQQNIGIDGNDGNWVDACKDRKVDSPEGCQKMCQTVSDCVVFVYIGELVYDEEYRKSCCFRSVQSENNTITKAHHVTGPRFCGKYLKPT